MKRVTLTKKLISGRDAVNDTSRMVLGPVAADVVEDHGGGHLTVAFVTDAGWTLTADMVPSCYLGYVPEGTPEAGQQI